MRHGAAVPARVLQKKAVPRQDPGPMVPRPDPLLSRREALPVRLDRGHRPVQARVRQGKRQGEGSADEDAAREGGGAAVCGGDQEASVPGQVEMQISKRSFLTTVWC